mmetsp:Transcript_64922/g.205089  ORF Transcript_64922/g.205089 Transcript_64922/m.205089 type:complete len:90 (-) Transcript_64922:52-321(-)
MYRQGSRCQRRRGARNLRCPLPVLTPTPTVYTTSNNLYGLKQVSQQEMPMQWNGIKGSFTSDFNGVKFKSTGFNSSRTTSRVHAAFDDF